MHLTSILKPEYCFQPRLLARRLFLGLKPNNDAEFKLEYLPWGLPIRVRPQEELGRAIAQLGVFDLALTETIWRLTEPGELVVDVGANLGYITAVLATRVNQSGGVVYGFEALPEVFSELQYNVNLWQTVLHKVDFQIQQIAISNLKQPVQIVKPPEFISNRGLAFVSSLPSPVPEATICVEATTLDEIFLTLEKHSQIGLLKVDVEGYELEVFQGATQLFKAGKIRDCIFEEHENYPTKVTQLLEDFGYQIFQVERSFFKALLLPPNSRQCRTFWLAPNFLATRNPHRAIALLSQNGWQCLGHHTFW
jgi:FkbM family methyltransferase